MKYRYALCSLLLLVASTASAQFLGDSLAAAGYNITEQQAMEGLAAIAGGGRLPQASTLPSDVSLPRESATPSAASLPREVPNASPASHPREANTYEPPKPGVTSVSGNPAPAGSIGATETPVMEAMGGAPTVYGGGGRIATPEEAAEFKAAFRAVGTTVNAPPAGSEVVQGPWGTVQYHKGVFYKQQANSWIVIPAPIGAKVKDRPAGASLLSHKNVPYLYYNGAFFVWNKFENVAEVVQAPVGAIVTNVPETATKQDRNGKACYVYGGTCFSPSFRGTNVVYVVG